MKLLNAILGFAFLASSALLLIPTGGAAQMTTGEYGTAINTAAGTAGDTGTKIGGTAIGGAHIEGLNRSLGGDSAAHDVGRTVIQEVPLEKAERPSNPDGDWQPAKPR